MFPPHIGIDPRIGAPDLPPRPARLTPRRHQPQMLHLWSGLPDHVPQDALLPPPPPTATLIDLARDPRFRRGFVAPARAVGWRVALGRALVRLGWRLAR